MCYLDAGLHTTFLIKGVNFTDTGAVRLYQLQPVKDFCKSAVTRL